PAAPPCPTRRSSDLERQWRNTHLRAYGYGWRLADAHGLFSVSHTGTLGGMYSVLHLLPELDAGFVVLINGSGAAARTVLDQLLLDRKSTRLNSSHVK